MNDLMDRGEEPSNRDYNTQRTVKLNAETVSTIARHVSNALSIRGSVIIFHIKEAIYDGLFEVSDSEMNVSFTEEEIESQVKEFSPQLDQFNERIKKNHD